LGVGSSERSEKTFFGEYCYLEKVLSLDSHHRLAHLKLAELKRKEGLEEEARWHEAQSKRGEEGTDPPTSFRKNHSTFPASTLGE
jgi:hypothetical protein